MRVNVVAAALPHGLRVEHLGGRKARLNVDMAGGNRPTASNAERNQTRRPRATRTNRTARENGRGLAAALEAVPGGARP